MGKSVSTRVPVYRLDTGETDARFTGSLKLHSVILRVSDSPACPNTLLVFHNRDDMDFGSAVDLQPTQTLSIARSNEIQELPVKRAVFNNVYSLTLFVQDNHGGEASEHRSRITYLGFKGEWKDLNREPVEFLYEKAANPRDHQLAAGIGQATSRQGL